MKINPITSRTIDNLRLPLMAGVVLIHCNPIEFCKDPGVMTEFLSSFVCNDITRVCVPLFFFIAGYLFFHGVERFTPTLYLKKVKSRTRSLLIPYLCWGTVAFLIESLGEILSGAATAKYIKTNIVLAYYGHLLPTTTDILDPYNVPFDYPLWFVRDLYVYVLLSPLIYYAIKKTGFLVPLLFSVSFLTGWWERVPFCCIYGVLYFPMGAWFAIKRIEPTEIIKRYDGPARAIVTVYPLLMIFDAVAYVWLKDIYYYAHTLQIYVGVMAVFIIFNKLSAAGKARSLISGQAIFAIFAIHGIIDYFFLEHAMPSDLASAPAAMLFIIIDFVVLVGLSLGIYLLVRRLSPWVGRLLFGPRDAEAPVFRRR